MHRELWGEAFSWAGEGLDDAMRGSVWYESQHGILVTSEKETMKQGMRRCWMESRQYIDRRCRNTKNQQIVIRYASKSFQYPKYSWQYG